MAAKTIRVGLIGCGGNMRGAHIKRLSQVRGVKIAGIAEPVAENVGLARQMYGHLAGVPAFDDYRKMLKQLEPEAVVISTPHNLHCKQICDSLRAGCHVLVEKPMVCTVAEARRVIRTRDQAKREVVVSYQRHQQPEFKLIKRIIESGQLGEIQFITAIQNQNWYYNQGRKKGSWRIIAEKSGGGQLNDSGSHMMDILLHVSGLEAKTVVSYQQDFTFDVDVNSAIAVEFRNGAIGTINVVGNAPGIGGAVWEDITFHGSKGALYYRMLAQPNYRPVLQLRKFDVRDPVPLPKPPKPSDPDRHFIDVIRGKAQNEAPAECGLRVIELTEAAWKSAATGAPVRVRRART